MRSIKKKNYRRIGIVSLISIFCLGPFMINLAVTINNPLSEESEQLHVSDSVLLGVGENHTLYMGYVPSDYSIFWSFTCSQPIDVDVSIITESNYESGSFSGEHYNYFSCSSLISGSYSPRTSDSYYLIYSNDDGSSSAYLSHDEYSSFSPFGGAFTPMFIISAIIGIVGTVALVVALVVRNKRRDREAINTKLRSQTYPTKTSPYRPTYSQPITPVQSSKQDLKPAFCQFCGIKINESAPFCSICGSKL